LDQFKQAVRVRLKVGVVPPRTQMTDPATDPTLALLGEVRLRVQRSNLTLDEVNTNFGPFGFVELPGSTFSVWTAVAFDDDAGAAVARELRAHGVASWSQFGRVRDKMDWFITTPLLRYSFVIRPDSTHGDRGEMGVRLYVGDPSVPVPPGAHILPYADSDVLKNKWNVHPHKRGPSSYREPDRGALYKSNGLARSSGADVTLAVQCAMRECADAVEGGAQMADNIVMFSHIETQFANTGPMDVGALMFATETPPRRRAAASPHVAVDLADYQVRGSAPLKPRWGCAPNPHPLLVFEGGLGWLWRIFPCCTRVG